jgi:hypothetical protein
VVVLQLFGEFFFLGFKKNMCNFFVSSDIAYTGVIKHFLGTNFCEFSTEAYISTVIFV